MKPTITTLFEAEEVQVQSLKMRDDLDPKIWDRDNGYRMWPDVKSKLMETAEYFLKYCDTEEFGIDLPVRDIILTGSLANYNWSSYSDIDIHIVADMGALDETTTRVLQGYLELRKKQFAMQHDIRVKSYEVEMYVQDGMEGLVALGVYSMLNDEWVRFPEKQNAAVDWDMVKRKAMSYMDAIDEIEDAIGFGSIKSSDSVMSRLKSIWKKIKSERRSGLDEAGEFAIENLVFKALRRNGYIQKIMDARSKLVSHSLSLAQ